jgi:hypothetical protein
MYLSKNCICFPILPLVALVLQAGNPPGERWAQRAGAAVPGDGTGTAGLSHSAHRIFSRFCSLLPPPRQNRNPTFAWFPWHVIFWQILLNYWYAGFAALKGQVNFKLSSWDLLLFNCPELLTVYAPMIYTAPCVMLFMRAAASITREARKPMYHKRSFLQLNTFFSYHNN